MANEIDKQLDEAAKTLKPAFKKVVDSLADSNKAVALTAANFRNSSRDSFKGALAAQKVRDTLSKVADGLKSGEGQLGNIDFAEFKKVSEQTQLLEQQLATAQEERAVRLATAEKKTNELGKKDLQISALKEKSLGLQGAALNKVTKELEELDKEREEQKKRILAGLDRRVEDSKTALEEETKTRDDYNNQLEGILKATNEESGKRLGEFSDGLKELTGFDLMDSFDSVVKKINGVGLLFGRQDLFGDVVGGLQNFASATGSALSSLSSSVMAGLSATGSYFAEMGDLFMEGGLSEVAAKLGADLGNVYAGMRDGAKSMMESVKTGFGKGVTMLKTGFASFQTGAMSFLTGTKKFLMSVGKAVVGMGAAAVSLVMAGASLLMTGVTMLAAALGLSVPALLIGVVALALIAGAFYLYENSEGFRAAIDTVVEYFTNIISIIGDIFGGFYDFFAGLFTGDFDRMFGGLKDVFNGIWDLIKAPFKAIGDFFKNVFDIDIMGIMRNLASKILPDWLVNRVFGEETEPEAPKKQEAMERGVQPNLSSEEIDNLSTAEQVKLGYAEVTGTSDRMDEQGNVTGQNIEYASTDKYQDVLRGEGVTSGGGFTGSARDSIADDVLATEQGQRQAEMIAQESQAVKAGDKQAMNQAVVTTVNNQTSNSAQTQISSVNPTPRDNDPTGSRLSAVPA